MPMIVRPANTRDVAALTALYNDLGVATTASYDLRPVTADERRAWLSDHIAHDWPVLVAENDGQVIGFAAYGPFRPKAGYRHTVEHSVYVRDEYQGQGVGRALLTALLGAAQARRVHAVVGVVDAANAASIAFHEHLGFQTVGTLPQVGRKFGRWLDVTFQVLLLPELPDDQEDDDE